VVPSQSKPKEGWPEGNPINMKVHLLSMHKQDYAGFLGSIHIFRRQSKAKHVVVRTTEELKLSKENMKNKISTYIQRHRWGAGGTDVPRRQTRGRQNQFEF